MVGLRPHGMPETDSLKEVFDAKAFDMTWEQWQELLASTTHARRASTLEELANMAAFLASDQAERDDGNDRQPALGTLDD